MRTIAEEMLSRINAEIKLLNYDNDITADDALHMVKFITPLYSQLRKLVSDYVFPTNEDEILFFKEITYSSSSVAISRLSAPAFFDIVIISITSP